jgi:hypothetical protein
MSKENSQTTELIARVEEARNALDAALGILKGGGDPLEKANTAHAARTASSPALDFTMPIRPFVKKHSGGMNGPQKFTLLLAYLTKGDTTKAVGLSAVEAQWSKMTGKNLLGMKFNRFYTAQARENDWASTEKAGAYRLRPAWKAIFNG